MELNKIKIADYATTLGLAAIPVIVAYQAEIAKYVPVEGALAFTIIMGVLSQLAANKRVKAASEEVQEVLDESC